MPSLAVVVFQVMPYGAVVSSVPRSLPSSLNCTPTAPVAVALTATEPLTVALLAGALIDTERPGSANARIVPASPAVTPFQEPAKTLPSATIGAA